MKKIKVVLMVMLALFSFTPAFAATTGAPTDPYISQWTVTHGTRIELNGSGIFTVNVPRTIAIAIEAKCERRSYDYETGEEAVYGEYWTGFVVGSNTAYSSVEIEEGYGDEFTDFIIEVYFETLPPVRTSYNIGYEMNLGTKNHTGLAKAIVKSAFTGIKTVGGVTMVDTGDMPVLSKSDIDEVCGYESYYGKGSRDAT